jgi:hypothetical protein
MFELTQKILVHSCGIVGGNAQEASDEAKESICHQDVVGRRFSIGFSYGASYGSGGSSTIRGREITPTKGSTLTRTCQL